MQAASKIAPNDYRPYYKAGAIKERLGDHQAALDQLQMAGRLKPADMEIASRIATLRSKTGASASGAIASNGKADATKSGNTANWNNSTNSSVASTAPTISMTPPASGNGGKSGTTPVGSTPVTAQTTGAITKSTVGPPASANINIPQSQLAQTAPSPVKQGTASATGTGSGAAQVSSVSGVKAATPPAGVNTGTAAVNQAPALQNTVNQTAQPRKTHELLSPGPPNINVSAGF